MRRVCSYVMLVVMGATTTLYPCTSILVSRGASKDGSVMITYSADAPFMPKLLYVPGGRHEPDESIDIVGWEDNEVRGKVRQAEVTYSVVGLINEHQLALGETTTGGRRELVNRNGLLDYDALMLLTLQRAKTAREAIRVIDQLVTEYGYASSGETISIADPMEAWVLEIIGRGPDVPGALWVAARVPDGMISASANMSRITTFPLDDPENWQYSPDLIQFAIDKHYYDPNSGKPFSYRDAYHPDQSVVSRRTCGARIWSIYRRAAPSATLADAWHRGEEQSEDYPLFIKPDALLSCQDVMALMRDHYEGTPYDMTKGLDAGPFASPYRFRGLTWKVDDKTYCWERPISTQQAGFVMVTQSRSSLPDPVGGVYWYTPDDPYSSCFTPLYCGINRLPEPYVKGDHDRFSWDSAWWIFNMVSNLAYDRWSRVFPDVQKAQRECEQLYFDLQPTVDQAAAALAGNPELMTKYLTDYSVGSAERLFDHWRELATYILTKHNDGFVNDLVHSPRGVGYAKEWLEEVLKQKGAQLEIKSAKEPTSH